MPNVPRAHNHNTVYILGAGASADAGMPLVKDFLSRMRDAADWLESQERDKERKAIDNVLKFRLDAASAAYRVSMNLDDIEELFSLAAASESAESLTRDMSHAIAATLDYCQRTARAPLLSYVDRSKKDGGTYHLPKSWRERAGEVALGVPTPEHTFARLSGSTLGPNIRGSVTFISFNYDLVVETALNAIGVKPHYGPISINDHDEHERSKAVTLLKLHGSINWGPSPNKQLPGGMEIYETYDALRAADVAPMIVPPTWNKNFNDFFAMTWHAAVRALRDATRVAIVGFSLPTTDAHFKYLLAAGLQHNISLRKLHWVNQDEAAYSRLRTILRQQVAVQDDRMWIAGFAGGNTRAFENFMDI